MYTIGKNIILCLVSIMVKSSFSIDCEDRSNECPSITKLLRLQCNGSVPDKQFLNETIADHHLVMGNCNFSGFDMENFFGDKKVHSIGIEYDKNETFPLEVTVHNIPSLCRLLIKNSQARGNFQLSFKNLSKFVIFEAIGHGFNTFPNRPFSDLHSLMELQLKNGKLVNLPEDIFNGLNSLLYLNLEFNALTEVKRMTFSSLQCLKSLLLNGNQIKQLQDNLFEKLSNLKILEVAKNNLQDLPGKLFRYCPNLTRLRIDENSNIISFPSRFFSPARFLNFLNASKCSLRLLEEQIFFNKETTSVSDERLKLAFLDLSYNKLTRILNETFNPLENLYMLNLSYNPLTYLPEEFPFGFNENLSEIYVSSCQLTKFPKIKWTKVNLKVLDLSYNRITMVTLPVYTKIRTEVKLDYNSIANIKMDDGNPSNAFPSYSIKGNSLLCNCGLKDFLHFLHSQIQKRNQIFTNESLQQKCQKENSTWTLIDVFPHNLSCDSSSCLRDCECITKETQIILNCSNRNLQKVPFAIPEGVTTVHLQNNNIIRLSIRHHSWYNVEHLYVSGNQLESLNVISIPHLSELSLHDNKLNDLPLKLLNKIDVSPNFSLCLSNNRWTCYCESVNLIKWMKINRRKIVDYENLTCYRIVSDNSGISSLIREVNANELCSNDSLLTSGRNVGIFIGVSISMPLVLLLTFLCCYACRHKDSILAMMYIYDLYCNFLDNQREYEDKMYDAFLFYIPEDRQIAHNIVRQLEPKYYFCIQERDWIPENDVIYSIVHSIQNSRTIVLLLSENFVVSTWFGEDFQRAYRCILDPKPKIILICIDDIKDIKSLQYDVQRMLSYKTSIKWTERLFWEKMNFVLRYNTNST